MNEIKLQKRYKYAGDVFNELLKADFDLETAERFCNNIPDADVVEVRHGEWKLDISEGVAKLKCSECDYEASNGLDVHRYCPNCGAKMDGVSNG